MSKKKHIVVIGAGFAGLRFTRLLNDHPDYQITLIDKNNYHQFQPLLYQVATGSLDASNIAFPLRFIFKKSSNVKFILAEVYEIFNKENKIVTSFESIYYDYLVIATGAETNYFGNQNIQDNAFPMKSTLEALQLRNQLIRNFEIVSLLTDQALIERLLTIVVVGGGPTGIELSGALAEMKTDVLPKEYPDFDFSKMKIYLLEGTDKVLGTMSAASSTHSKKYLEEMGVLVKTKTIVKDYNGENVLLQDGTVIASALVIWAAGVKGSILKGINKEMITRDNRIKVDNFNKILDTENIFVLGDLAFMESAKYPKGYPQLATVAMDQAKNLAKNFKYVAKGKLVREYKFHNKGSMATVGRNKAVVDFEKPHLSFQGFFAWILWMTVHLFFLIGLKNRIVVFINWVYQYFTRSESFSLLFYPLLRKK